jgi:hypothetical protein
MLQGSARTRIRASGHGSPDAGYNIHTPPQSLTRHAGPATPIRAVRPTITAGPKSREARPGTSAWSPCGVMHFELTEKATANNKKA